MSASTHLRGHDEGAKLDDILRKRHLCHARCDRRCYELKSRQLRTKEEKAPPSATDWSHCARRGCSECGKCFRSDRNGRFLACFDASGASTLWARRSRPLFPVSHAPPPRGGFLHTHSRLQHRGDASWGLSDGRTTALPTAISPGKGNDYSSCLLVYKSSTLSVPLNPHRQPSFVSKFCRCCGSQVDLFNQLCPSNNKLGPS
jgi:hypothetical protein